MQRAIKIVRPEIAIGIILRLAAIGLVLGCLLSGCMPSYGRTPRNKGAEVEREHPARRVHITKQARRAVRWAANHK